MGEGNGRRLRQPEGDDLFSGKNYTKGATNLFLGAKEVKVKKVHPQPSPQLPCQTIREPESRFRGDTC